MALSYKHLFENQWKITLIWKLIHNQWQVLYDSCSMTHCLAHSLKSNGQPGSDFNICHNWEYLINYNIWYFDFFWIWLIIDAFNRCNCLQSRALGTQQQQSFNQTNLLYLAFQWSFSHARIKQLSVIVYVSKIKNHRLIFNLCVILEYCYSVFDD